MQVLLDLGGGVGPCLGPLKSLYILCLSIRLKLVNSLFQICIFFTAFSIYSSNYWDRNLIQLPICLFPLKPASVSLGIVNCHLSCGPCHPSIAKRWSLPLPGLIAQGPFPCYLCRSLYFFWDWCESCANPPPPAKGITHVGIYSWLAFCPIFHLPRL